MISIIKQTLHDFLQDKCPRMAAALAYYTAFALAPMLVLIISVCQLVLEPDDIKGRVEAEIAGVVGESGAEQVKTMIDSGDEIDRKSAIATGVGMVVMLIGATGLFAQLQGTMNDVWEVTPDPVQSGLKNFLMKRLVSLGMLLTVAFLLMVSITASTIIHAFDGQIDRWLPGQYGSAMVKAADYGISMLVITCLFAAMFKVLPDAKISWSNVWVGAAATSVLFVAGKFAVGLYVGSQNMANTYGAAGSLVMILVWVYYSAMIFLLGAEFTQAWARSRGHGIEPAKGAVRVTRSFETNAS